MNIFRSIVFSAVVAGLLVGLVATVAHQFGTVPLILKAETYENAAPAAPAATPAPAAPAAEPAHEHAGHEHSAEAWAPADGLERTLYTAFADVITHIGFALLLVGLYVVTGRQVTWREGLMWGLAGFAVFTVAPALGLPPELPGMPASEVGPRQVWWIATALSTAAGLGLIFLTRSPVLAVVGIAVIVVPHLIGAPVQPEEATAVPHSLWRSFVTTVTLTSFVLWALLGGITGALHQRFFGRTA